MNYPITLAPIIADIISKKNIDPTEGIIHHSEGIELTLAPMIGREIILRKYINKVKSLYDYCLIDTAPTFDVLTVNALVAANLNLCNRKWPQFHVLAYCYLYYLVARVPM